MNTIATVNYDGDVSELIDTNTKILALTNSKTAKKAFKRTADLSLVIFWLSLDNSSEICSLIDYLRKGLSNGRVRIIVMMQELDSEQYSRLLTRYEVDLVVVESEQTSECLLAIVRAELRTFNNMLQSERRRETEIRILTTLGKMSRDEFSDHECVTNLLDLLREATGAHTSRAFWTANEEAPDPSTPTLLNEPHSDLGSGPWELVKTALSQQCQQLCIDDQAEDHRRSTLPTAASIALPLQCYDQTLVVLHLMLPPESLGTLTVEFVELLGKLGEQVRILFERRASEGELQTQFDRVKQALQKLESTQMKLYQSEKLASVGQLAAGIAHEINNPITFLAGNMRPLEDYTASMSAMLELHQDFIKEIDNSTPKLWEMAENHIKPKAEELDISFIIEDVRSLVSESKEGLQRVSDIVHNLTRFARKDSLEHTPANLEVGLDDSIRMLKLQIDESINIKKEYCQLPEVVCSHGLVNQVFLNLIKNAAQAIGTNGTITIRTENVRTAHGLEAAKVSVSDDGQGISEDSKSRIFEPFFTTKAVGEGTGLGLSMCYDIINRHGGDLSFTSRQGKGTEFVVVLPFKPIIADESQQDVA